MVGLQQLPHIRQKVVSTMKESVFTTGSNVHIPLTSSSQPKQPNLPFCQCYDVRRNPEKTNERLQTKDLTHKIDAILLLLHALSSFIAPAAVITHKANFTNFVQKWPILCKNDQFWQTYLIP